MKSIVMVGVVLALSTAVPAFAEDNYTVVKAPPGEPDVSVKVDAPKGTSEQDIAHAIAAENAKRDPAAQQAAQVAKRKADEDQAHAERISKICDSIPERAMRDDPSLRKMCQ